MIAFNVFVKCKIIPFKATQGTTKVVQKCTISPLENHRKSVEPNTCLRMVDRASRSQLLYNRNGALGDATKARSLFGKDATDKNLICDRHYFIHAEGKEKNHNWKTNLCDNPKR